jgi:hypothetical protein
VVEERAFDGRWCDRTDEGEDFQVDLVVVADMIMILRMCTQIDQIIVFTIEARSKTTHRIWRFRRQSLFVAMRYKMVEDSAKRVQVG